MAVARGSWLDRTGDLAVNVAVNLLTNVDLESGALGRGDPDDRRSLRAGVHPEGMSERVGHATVAA